ncbi:TPA: hypothetical protein ACH3X3_000309 [Trebouxia sp. C0006]
MSAPVKPAGNANQPHYSVTDKPRQLDDEDMAFIVEYTNGGQVAALREHVLRVWQRAKQELWVYKCIQQFMFLIPKISRHPFYPKVLAAHQESQGQHMLHLDVGACLGQDTRRLMTDGCGQHQIIALDLVADYWKMGKVLFLDEDRMHVPLIVGSLTDEGFVSADNCYLRNSQMGDLIGAADFLWAAAVLHILSKADCEKFVSSAHLLLKPGGTFYGWTVGNREAGDWHTTPDGKAKRYLHSAESLHAMFMQLGFSKATVEYTSGAMWTPDDSEERQIEHLCFSATK